MFTTPEREASAGQSHFSVLKVSVYATLGVLGG